VLLTIRGHDGTLQLLPAISGYTAAAAAAVGVKSPYGHCLLEARPQWLTRAGAPWANNVHLSLVVVEPFSRQYGATLEYRLSTI